MLPAKFLVFLLLAIVCHVAFGFHEECRETLRAGKLTVENVAQNLAEREILRISGLIESAARTFKEFNPEQISHSPLFQSLIQIKDDQQPCPQPNNTMFTTPKPPTTLPPASTSAAPSSAAPAQTSSASPSSSAAPALESEPFLAPKIHAATHEEDPFHQYISTLHYYMSREEHVCNNKFTDLNSVTEDQLFGFFSTLAANQPGPFCSLCHRFTEEVQNRVFRPNQLLITDDNFHFSNLVFSHLPSPKALCSTIAPGCHDDYAIKVANLTESVICLECSACMSITNVIVHKFLLQQQVVDSLFTFLRGNLFHNLCAELCITFQGHDMPLFPNGFSYDGCQAVLKKQYYSFISVASVLLKPERFCSLELGWCELNEQPNALHCLREMCLEHFKDTPQTRWLCSQIPDRPDSADEYLNIKRSKIYKEKKDYHNDFEVHEEL
ncbi:unnamed protein product [Caenorhabditis angaria]|uniref:Saposin B-type domain-containing protein n=1 Tax=Caenorhabditis angaria TaxID=860376 RepID=A0A9P1MTM1_9PELO|nr:unnamed protein product [Caenorhabditis angaria]